MIESLFKEINAIYNMGLLLPTILTFTLSVFVCLYGYRFFKLLIMILGLVVGLAVSVAISHQSTSNELVSLLFGVGGGCVGAFLFKLLYPASVFIFGAAVSGAVILFAQGDSTLAMFIAIAGGILTLFLQKFAIILFTSLAGANGIVSTFSFFFLGNKLIPLQTLRRLYVGPIDYMNVHIYVPGHIIERIILWLLCFIIGIACTVFQYRNIARLKHKKSSENKTKGSES